MNNTLNALDTLSNKLFGKYFRELTLQEQSIAVQVLQAKYLSDIGNYLIDIGNAQ